MMAWNNESLESVKTEREGEMNENSSEVVVNDEVPTTEEVVKGLHLFQDFSWGKRARSAFHQCNIHTLEQLLAMNPRRLTRVENVGRKTLKDIQKTLEARGLSLKLSQNMLQPSHPGRLAGLEKARDMLKKNRKLQSESMTYAQDYKRQGIMSEVGRDFVDAMDMAIAHGAIPAARGLLDCCTPVMAKKIIDVVSAIEREMT